MELVINLHCTSAYLGGRRPASFPLPHLSPGSHGSYDPQSHYQARLDFIQLLLRDKFSIKDDAEITPIQYDPESPFKYNNFVYRVSLSSPLTLDDPAKDGARQPGCVPIPNGTKEFIMRLTNPDAEGMNQKTRVENEVAIITLATAALQGFQSHVVPSIYAWGSAATQSSQGYIIQELMPGSPLDEIFDDMNIEEKRQIINSPVTSLLGAGGGGVTFDGAGEVVSTAMTSVGAGPWPTYEASFKGRLEVALQRADKNPYIKGWRANGIRERLDAFVERGVPSQFGSLNSAQERVIVHADFTANNILFDTTTKRITALIDYDFACILHPSYEFFRSFDGAGGQLRGWSGDEDSEQSALREAKLHGFPSPLPQSTKDGVQWEVARAWEDELEKLDVKRPRTIAGIDKVADVDGVLRTILPWRLSNSDILRMQSESVILGAK
ncbi:hypothetical protein PISL3812_04510 [Talaromyces islandicus]|uniref:Aminoglycoside phosphotransferase domain-containing protein n=1 Tax=Talaromyces islandicus TaxID=28573 RepID=A0A0U1LWN2_TALIS|nr:hypothetical protein PISL3812_04510 [Talaromyces islandicus]